MPDAQPEKQNKTTEVEMTSEQTKTLTNIKRALYNLLDELHDDKNNSEVIEIIDSQANYFAVKIYPFTNSICFYMQISSEESAFLR